jgi:hypothetical protein
MGSENVRAVVEIEGQEIRFVVWSELHEDRDLTFVKVGLGKYAYRQYSKVDRTVRESSRGQDFAYSGGGRCYRAGVGRRYGRFGLMLRLLFTFLIRLDSAPHLVVYRNILWIT